MSNKIIKEIVKESFRIPGTDVIVNKGQTLSITKESQNTDKDLKTLKDLLATFSRKERRFSYDSRENTIPNDGIMFTCYIDFENSVPWKHITFTVGVNLNSGSDEAFVIGEYSLIESDAEYRDSRAVADIEQVFLDEVSYLSTFEVGCEFEELKDLLDLILQATYELES